MSLILDGKLVAAQVKAKVATGAGQFLNRYGRKPQLAVILVGDDVASQVYVRNKEKACAEVGFESSLVRLPASITQAELEAKIQGLVQDPRVDGVLVQLPLPKGLSSDRVQALLDPSKDADGFTWSSLGALMAGRGIVSPCTPAGVMEILKHYQIPVKGAHAVVVGRSLIVGKPMAQLLLAEDATVTVCHSKTPDLTAFTRNADIVVAAIGQRHFFGPEHFKKSAVVIDVGIHGSGAGQGVTGDVRFDEVKDLVRAITPVPGGVGPMTIAMLLKNTLALAEARAGASSVDVQSENPKSK